jgi:lysophospholipase L1-like esterase
MHLRLLICTLLIALSVSRCQSQWRPPVVDITEKDTVGYSFLRDQANVIENAAQLKPFFNKLYLQRTQGGSKVNVVHIGDSHILGNFLTNEVRHRLQNEFGDAGRGVIFPYKLINSNGPRDYLVSSTARWSGTNCTRDLNDITNYGISGFSAITNTPNGAITFRLRDTSASTTSMFTKVTVFFRNDEQSTGVIVEDESTRQLADAVLEDEFSQTFYFDRPVSECTIKLKKGDSKKGLWLDGISIDNERAGLIYHSIGVNGAKFSDFGRSKYFARQMKELTPDLVILSFGTNEAQAKASPALLEKQMDDLISQILTQWPHAAILLTTPADSYLRGKGFNPYMSDVSDIIRQYARKKDYALWDLFNIGGGANSAAAWKSNGLMSSDSVHYSKTGYVAQGKLLYQGLIKGYNEIAASNTAKASGEGKK